MLAEEVVEYKGLLQELRRTAIETSSRTEMVPAKNPFLKKLKALSEWIKDSGKRGDKNSKPFKLILEVVKKLDIQQYEETTDGEGKVKYVRIGGTEKTKHYMVIIDVVGSIYVISNNDYSKIIPLLLPEVIESIKML